MYRPALFALLLSVCLAACGGGSGGDDSLSLNNQNACQAIGLNIINGESCFPGDSPGGTPLVRIILIDGFGNQALCSGTAIASNAVLTAAHCFLSGVSAIQVDTLFGPVGVFDIVVHPGFFLSARDIAAFNDVAVIFTEPMRVSTFPILVSQSPVVGEDAFVAGFGTDNRGGFGSLQAGAARISDVSANHIFTSFSGAGSNPCQGDSGGPLLVDRQGQLVVSGVVSSGNPNVRNCGVGDVTLYANLSSPDIRGFLESLLR